jgi:hypothetical protein
MVGIKIKHLVFDRLRQCLPSIDLSDLDLTGRQQSPEQHRHGIGARQDSLVLTRSLNSSLKRSMALLVRADHHCERASWVKLNRRFIP